jgi:hypothetical protein
LKNFKESAIVTTDVNNGVMLKVFKLMPEEAAVVNVRLVNP